MRARHPILSPPVYWPGKQRATHTRRMNRREYLGPGVSSAFPQPHCVYRAARPGGTLENRAAADRTDSFIGLCGQLVGELIAGSLAERFGRLRIAGVKIAIFATMSLLCAFAWNPHSMMLFRFLQGIGLGGEVPVAGASTSGERCSPCVSGSAPISCPTD
jgi:Major Facilitator Superfamily